MKVFLLFDYIFYRIAQIEQKFDYGDIKEFAGASIISLLQTILLLTILKSILVFNHIEINNFYIYILSSLIMFGIFNYIRYYRVITFETIAKKYENETAKTRKVKGFYISLFVLIIIIIWGIV
jgi:hypothetical protein